MAGWLVAESDGPVAPRFRYKGPGSRGAARGWESFVDSVASLTASGLNAWLGMMLGAFSPNTLLPALCRFLFSSSLHDVRALCLELLGGWYRLCYFYAGWYFVPRFFWICLALPFRAAVFFAVAFRLAKISTGCWLFPR